MLEEYIARRKKEDNLNEFDVEVRTENLRTCVNYIFEYFNNYLDITEAENSTALAREKIEKYRHQVIDYSPNVQDWLVSINTEYGHYLNRTIGWAIDQDMFFFLYNTDGEFRNVSYEVYAKLSKKHPYLKDQTEMLFQFVKDYHRIRSQPDWRTEIPFIDERINLWVEDTWTKYQVNLPAFASKWVNYFWDHDELWPARNRISTGEDWKKFRYDYRKAGNLFNLNSLYNKMPRKPFTRSHKQDFEIIMMYFWLHDIVGDEDSYWQEYLEKVLSHKEQ